LGDLSGVKNYTNPEQEGAGRAVETVEEQTVPGMDRTQILRSIREAYGSGKPVESVMRERMAAVRAGVCPDEPGAKPPSIEYGRSAYKKRGCGKVASFLRCLLR
jgi:hypothetical protein